MPLRTFSGKNSIWPKQSLCCNIILEAWFKPCNHQHNVSHWPQKELDHPIPYPFLSHFQSLLLESLLKARAIFWPSLIVICSLLAHGHRCHTAHLDGKSYWEDTFIQRKYSKVFPQQGATHGNIRFLTAQRVLNFASMKCLWATE